MLRYAQHESRGKRVWSGERVFVGHGIELGIRWIRKQVPRCARNDNLRVLRRIAGVWLWLRDSAFLRFEAVGRGEGVGLGVSAGGGGGGGVGGGVFPAEFSLAAKGRGVGGSGQ